MNRTRLGKIQAIFILGIFVTLAMIPFISASTDQNEPQLKSLKTITDELIFNKGDYIPYDRIYHYEPDYIITAVDHNDVNYNTDAGDKFNRADILYVGERIDTGPGRGRIGYLQPESDQDTDDFYRFFVCEGQIITASFTTSEDYGFQLYDPYEVPISSGFIATETDWHYIQIFSNPSAVSGEYEFDVTLTGQNDAGIGDDAGDTIGTATPIVQGVYTGYMDMSDWEDWYSFSVNDGDGIYVKVFPKIKSDFDVYLYNPSDELEYYVSYYGTDELEYPADESGTWKIKIDMFPGWDETKWPDDYYLYGSGPYILTLEIGDTFEAPPTPEPQPEIIPVAQTFIVENDPDSNKDEYGYIAAIPAANYRENDIRYVSPIVYEGETTPTHWSGTVDDTTQYLVDDWNTYLDRHAMTATEYTLASDPIEAAADIATTSWTTSDSAVIVVDGSDIEDPVRNVLNRNIRLNAETKVTSVPPDSPDLLDLGGLSAYQMFVGPKWGAISVHGLGDNFNGDVGITTPRYEAMMDDWWPHPDDETGPDTDVYYPVTFPGFWFPYMTSTVGLDELQITKIAGKRHRIPIRTTDCSLKVTVTTDEPTYLRIYLVDPYGNVRRPMVPHWNGGDINPIHVWNGGHWDGIGYDEWRSWVPELSTEHVQEIHYPMTGLWRAIVVPATLEAADQTYNYHITAEIRTHAQERNAAALSAANGAVIASQEHIPLLYVKEDSVPTETADAISTLGVTEIIFVNADGIGDQVKSDLPGSVTDLNTMVRVVDYIDDMELNEDNFITITSLGTGDGYFAPAAMIAAYHSGPVLNIGEAPDAYNKLDMIAAWREYAGDYYHGCRSVGHLPMMETPFDFDQFIEDIKNDIFPAPGFDLKLRWFSAVNEGIVELITGYGLEKEGSEAYMFVAPRDNDIRDPISRAMTGNESYSGQIPVETPAFSSAVICRDIIYPALIYANPGRDVTTSMMMNHPDGGTWAGNDGKNYANYATREIKSIFSSNNRIFEGHCMWDNHLERMNEGTSINYYTGHGTGGSGISAQYKNFAEFFPQGHVTHEWLHDFDWWDGWRGYSGFDKAKTASPRYGGASQYNSVEPSLYDIIHFKYVDEQFGNLHSELEMWSSCTTGEHFGPMIYLEHGSAMWYGNAGSCYGIQMMLLDSWMYYDVMVLGKNFGESHAKYIWIFHRDFTTKDPTTLYGRSTFFQGGLTNVQVLYGDPTMTCYSPNWIEPEPINP
jgi:hypothetical protein